jgi:glycosyltransferase involved in cell wall biosynthesis
MNSPTTKVFSDEPLPVPVTVTAIVPARNEEKGIAACVQSLEQQPEIAQILVVDDQSTDHTADVVRSLAAEIPHLRLLEVCDLPPGWVGKNNALCIGAKEAHGDWLLFTDADAEMALGAVSRALRIASETKAVLISFSPEQITKAWYEKSLIPFIFCRLAKHFSYDTVNDSDSKAAAANGQFVMMRRDAYDGIGGHAGVAGEVLEDVALARRAKAAGQPIWFGSGKGIVRARMYRSLESMMEGWTKNLYQLVGGTPASVYRELLAVVPWVSMALLLFGIKLPLALLAGLGLLLARHAAYGSALTRNQFRVSYILYYVPAVVLYTTALWASYRAHVKGTVAWKGRQVSVGIPGTLR